MGGPRTGSSSQEARWPEGSQKTLWETVQSPHALLQTAISPSHPGSLEAGLTRAPRSLALSTLRARSVTLPAESGAEGPPGPTSC